MTLLHAQPYDISAEGFYFRSVDEYHATAKTIKNSFGGVVEEFEIQFIDGDELDGELAKAIGLYQSMIEQYFSLCDELSDEEKLKLIIAIGECGYSFDENTRADDFDIDIYEEETLQELAIRFVDEGLFGEVPERFQHYIDYNAIARDLSVDYTLTIIAGQRMSYRCG